MTTAVHALIGVVVLNAIWVLAVLTATHAGARYAEKVEDAFRPAPTATACPACGHLPHVAGGCFCPCGSSRSDFERWDREMAS